MAKRGKQKQKQKGKPAAETPARVAAESAASAADAAGGAAEETQEPADAEAVAGAVEAETAADPVAQETHSAGAVVEESPAAEFMEAAADEAETVAAAGPEVEAAESAAAVAPVRKPKPKRAARPRDPRSPFLVLADYEQRSLNHVAGLPEQLEAPGLWRGVAYRIGSRRLASGFEEVLEILPLPSVTHIPGSLPWMLGVANVRGTLLPVVDLKQFLEGERTVLQEKQRVLVVHQPGGDVAVIIDELYGQRSFVDAQSVDATAIADGRYAYFVERAYRHDGSDWGVFSLDRLSRTPEFRQAAA